MLRDILIQITTCRENQSFIFEENPATPICAKLLKKIKFTTSSEVCVYLCTWITKFVENFEKYSLRT